MSALAEAAAVTGEGWADPEPANGADDPEERAEGLLRDVLGPHRYREFEREGRLHLPSALRAGRVYRLDRDGTLSFRDAGERGFCTSLCIQAQEAVPRDDSVVLRYLMVIADEQRFLDTTNPIGFRLSLICRMVYREVREGFSRFGATCCTLVLCLIPLACLWGAVEAARHLLTPHFFWALLGLLLALAPGMIGVLLLALLAGDFYHLVLQPYRWLRRRVRSECREVRKE